MTMVTAYINMTALLTPGSRQWSRRRQFSARCVCERTLVGHRIWPQISELLVEISWSYETIDLVRAIGRSASDSSPWKRSYLQCADARCNGDCEKTRFFFCSASSGLVGSKKIPPPPDWTFFSDIFCVHVLFCLVVHSLGHIDRDSDP